MPWLKRWSAVLVLILLLPAPAGAGGSGNLSPELRDRLDQAGTHQVIVVYDSPPGQAERELLERWGSSVHWYDILPAARATLTSERLRAMDDLAGIARIVPDQGLEWTLAESTRTLRAGRAIEDLGYDGAGVGVAVVDSGIDPTHPALEDNVVANVRVTRTGHVVPINQDATGHGTHVAGIVAGTGAKSPQGSFQGVAPEANLVGVDVSQDFTTSTVLTAFDWIVEHRHAYDIRVVSASWGRTDQAYDPQDPIVRASSRLVEKGIVVVYSAGNAGPGESTLSVEAQNPDVVTVGAVNDATEIAPYSSRGPATTDVVKPDVVAPGEEITSTKATASTGGDSLLGGLLGGGEQESSTANTYYTTLSGTSQASPHVAGLAALLIGADPDLTPAEVKAALRASAVDLGAEGPDPVYGYGMADAKAALHLVLGLEPPRNVLVDGGTEIYTFRGEVTGAQGRAIQTFPAFHAHGDGAVESTFPVKPGASSIRVTFAWRPADAGFEVYLSDGERTYGPYTDSTEQGPERVVTFERSEDLSSGTWSVVAEPEGTNLHYRTSVAVSYATQGDQADPGTPTPGRDLGPALILIAVLVAAMAVAGLLFYKRRSARAAA